MIHLRNLGLTPQIGEIIPYPDSIATRRTIVQLYTNKKDAGSESCSRKHARVYFDDAYVHSRKILMFVILRIPQSRISP